MVVRSGSRLLQPSEIKVVRKVCNSIRIMERANEGRYHLGFGIQYRLLWPVCCWKFQRLCIAISGRSRWFSGSHRWYRTRRRDSSMSSYLDLFKQLTRQLQFHPLSPNHLFVASRRSDCIQLYDIRNPSDSVATLPRKGDTNQRIWFDLDPWGRYLTTGDLVCHFLSYSGTDD
jgi:hypothetical protein